MARDTHEQEPVLTIAAQLVGEQGGYSDLTIRTIWERFGDPNVPLPEGAQRIHNDSAVSFQNGIHIIEQRGFKLQVSATLDQLSLPGGMIGLSPAADRVNGCLTIAASADWAATQAERLHITFDSDAMTGGGVDGADPSLHVAMRWSQLPDGREPTFIFEQNLDPSSQLYPGIPREARPRSVEDFIQLEPTGNVRLKLGPHFFFTDDKSDLYANARNQLLSRMNTFRAWALQTTGVNPGDSEPPKRAPRWRRLLAPLLGGYPG